VAEPGPRDIGIYFLDVGQGDCSVIIPPAGEGGAIVVDIADQYVLERFVANHDIEVSDVIASHLDMDHIGGMLGFLLNQGDRVDRAYIGLDRFPAPGKNIALRKLLEQVETWTEHRPHPHIIQKDNWRDHEGPLLIREGDDWRVELVLPYNSTRSKALRQSGPQANMMSAVVRVVRGETAVLIGGDAPLGSWEQLHNRDPQLLPAAAIRTPHHGGDATEGGVAWKDYPALYDRVDAKLGVISVGTSNSYGHPHLDHVAGARREGECRLLCTQLTPRCHRSPIERREAMRNQATMVEPPYRQWNEAGQSRRPKEVPCAGSIVAWIDASGELHHEPSADSEHTKALLRVDNPQCQAPVGLGG